MIKKISFVFSLLLLTMIVSSSVSVGNKKVYKINWRPTYKLKWSDYKGTPEIRNALNTYTVVGVYYGSDELTACFYLNESWVKDTNSGSLAHEQVSFDIMELHARMMRKEISELSEKNKERKQAMCDVIVSNYTKKASDEHARYETETMRGKNLLKEKEWQLYVQRKLNEYAAY